MKNHKNRSIIKSINQNYISTYTFRQSNNLKTIQLLYNFYTTFVQFPYNFFPTSYNFYTTFINSLIPAHFPRSLVTQRNKSIPPNRAKHNILVFLKLKFMHHISTIIRYYGKKSGKALFKSSTPNFPCLSITGGLTDISRTVEGILPGVGPPSITSGKSPSIYFNTSSALTGSL